MVSEYYIRQKCAKAIGSQLAKRALDFVDDDMTKCAEKLIQVQGDFNEMVNAAVSKMMKGSY